MNHFTLVSYPSQFQPANPLSPLDDQGASDGTGLLDSQETTSQQPQSLQGRIATALFAGGLPDDGYQINYCGEDEVIVVCKGCARPERVTVRCKHRLCPRCARTRSKKLGKQYEPVMRAMRFPVHLVLTLKNVERIESETFTHIRRCFGRLIRRKLFRSCRGGFYSIETTRKGRGWHVHIHAILDCAYIPVQELSHVWEKITGGSRIVWIEKADPRGLQYVLKYITKVADFVNEPDAVAEYCEAVRGQRLVQTFGKVLYGQTKPDEWVLRCPGCGSEEWEFAGRLSDLLSLSLRDDGMGRWAECLINGGQWRRSASRSLWSNGGFSSD